MDMLQVDYYTDFNGLFLQIPISAEQSVEYVKYKFVTFSFEDTNKFRSIHQNTIFF